VPIRRRPSDYSPRIAHRVEHLGWASRVLHRIDHVTGQPAAAMAVLVGVVGLFTTGIVLHFTTGWVVGFETGTSTVTLLMVLAIQHTQSREQSATQRKLDELLRAMPEAENSFIMLEEASSEVLREVEETQRRRARSNKKKD
jgi:low affinity Fe/Cu permease